MPDKLIRVLHVDDLEEEFILVRELLSGVAGLKFEVHWAHDARTASQAIQNNDFDVCFVDYYLGKDNGLEFTRDALAGGTMTPFILMSGQKDHSIDREALKIGIRQCLDKNNITTSILVKAIKDVTGN